MKKPLLPLLLTLMFAGLLHAEKTAAGPKGGRLLETDGVKTEFFVTSDRKAEITFYDEALQPVAPGARTVTLTAEPKSGRTLIDLAQTSTGFRSTAALPAADEAYRLVVQVRASPEAKSQNFRLDLNLATCGECGHAEYACTCAGH